MNISHKYLINQPNISQNKIHFYEKVVQKYTMAFKKFHKNFEKEDSFITNVIDWLFSFPIQIRQMIVAVENKHLSSLIMDIFWNGKNRRFKFNEKDEIETYDDLPEDISKKGCEKRGFLDGFLYEIAFYNAESEITTINKQMLSNYFTLSKKFISNRENFMNYFKRISNNKCFTVPIKSSKDETSKVVSLNYPDWLFAGDRPCNLPEFIVAIFEQVISVKFFLYLNENKDINKLINVTFLKEVFDKKHMIEEYIKMQYKERKEEFLNAIKFDDFTTILLNNCKVCAFYDDSFRCRVPKTVCLIPFSPYPAVYQYGTNGINEVAKVKQIFQTYKTIEDVTDHFLFVSVSQVATFEENFKKEAFTFIDKKFAELSADSLLKENIQEIKEKEEDLSKNNSGGNLGGTKKKKKKKQKNFNSGYSLEICKRIMEEILTEVEKIEEEKKKEKDLQIKKEKEFDSNIILKNEEANNTSSTSTEQNKPKEGFSNYNEKKKKKKAKDGFFLYDTTTLYSKVKRKKRKPNKNKNKNSEQSKETSSIKEESKDLKENSNDTNKEESKEKFLSFKEIRALFDLSQNKILEEEIKKSKTEDDCDIKFREEIKQKLDNPYEMTVNVMGKDMTLETLNEFTKQNPFINSESPNILKIGGTEIEIIRETVKRKYYTYEKENYQKEEMTFTNEDYNISQKYFEEQIPDQKDLEIRTKGISTESEKNLLTEFNSALQGDKDQSNSPNTFSPIPENYDINTFNYSRTQYNIPVYPNRHKKYISYKASSNFIFYQHNPMFNLPDNLNNSITEFITNYQKPLLCDLAQIKRKIRDLIYRDCIKKAYPQSTVKIYGSLLYCTDIECSDLDICIFTNRKRDTLNPLVQLLYKNNPKYITEIQPILTAKVPVVKLSVNPHLFECKEIDDIYNFIYRSEYYHNYIFDKEELESIKIDITLNSIRSVQTGYIIENLNFFPEIKIVIKILKRLLYLKNLNLSYEGGIGSYSLFLLILAFFRYSTNLSNGNIYSNNCGLLLIDFILHYQSFNFDTYIINPNLSK
ncbi:MAG: hypothetical protein MJ252_06190 [archaeon]|nr:hypothetical protein [archaeon]